MYYSCDGDVGNILLAETYFCVTSFVQGLGQKLYAWRTKKDRLMLTRGTQDGTRVRCSDPLKDIKLPLMTLNGFSILTAESNNAP